MGRSASYGIVVASAIAWLASNIGQPGTELPVAIEVWNFAVNVTSFALLATLIARLRVLVDHERDLARTDFTTGVPNARAFHEALDGEIARCARRPEPLSLAYLDLDNFKAINDRFGHATGDAVLRAVADTVRSSLRAGDVVGRLGGDEFALMLTGAGEREGLGVLERLRERLGALAAAHDWPVSFSIGMVTCLTSPCTADELVRQADNLMYEVKAAGKNGLRHVVLDDAPS